MGSGGGGISTKGRTTEPVLSLLFYGGNAATYMKVGLAMGEAMAILFKAT